MLGTASRSGQRRLVAIAIVIFVLTTGYHLLLPGVGSFSNYNTKVLTWLPFGSSQNQATDNQKTNDTHLLPQNYQQIVKEITGLREPSWCNDRFSPAYLEDFRDHAIDYCGQGSQSHLTCFHGTLASQKRDILCIAEHALLDSQSMKFVARCDIRSPTDDESQAGIVAFNRMEYFWYQTGPRTIFETFWNIGAQKSLPEPQAATVPKYTILIKREGDTNFWHNLMEVFSTALTIDILRMSRANSTFVDPKESGNPMIPEDFKNTQVLILDEHNQGPVYDLWSLFTDTQPIRWQDVEADPSSAAVQSLFQPHHVIVPLPGGSNPLWQNDWEARDCTDSILLRAFVRRVLAHIGIEPGTPSSHPATPVPVRDRPLRVTVIDRRGSRQILNLESHVTALAAAFPSANITSVDLAGLSLSEQIHLIRDSDLLVGAHGAGLTHIMFKKPGEGGVVEFKPEGMDYMGFRNLAKMNGNQYWSTHAEIVPPEEVQERAEVRDTATSSGVLMTRDPWHFSNLKIEEEEFLRTVGDAIRALTIASGMGSTKGSG